MHMLLGLATHTYTAFPVVDFANPCLSNNVIYAQSVNSRIQLNNK